MSLSAQAFVRALRAPADPPVQGGPQKVELAHQAWAEASLYIPNKAELIVEWILSRFLKHKSKDNHPLLDPRYWQLLYTVLSADATRAGVIARNVRAWLVPLINRVPLAPIIRDFFAQLAAADVFIRSELSELAAPCILQIWPVAAPKLTPETLLECLGACVAFLNALGANEPLSKPVTQTIDLVVQTYKMALGNTANKKKLYSSFTQSYLAAWLTCLNRDDSDANQGSLVAVIFAAGVDTLFSLELLRQAGDQHLDDALRAELAKVLVAAPDVVLMSLPHLFKSYVQAIKRHRNTLFSQGSSQAPGHVATQVKTSGIAFFAAADELLAAVQEGDQLWNARIVLLQTIEGEDLYNAQDENATQLLIRTGQLAVEALKHTAHASQIDNAAQVLAVLTRIDYDIMSAFLSTTMRRLATVHTVSSVLTYFNLLLDYHSKTRTVPAFLSYWLEAFSAEYLRATGTAQECYSRASAGPLLDPAFISRLAICVRSYLTPSQVLKTAQSISQSLKDGFGGFEKLAATAATEPREVPRKKRKKSGVPSPSTASAESTQAAVSFALLARAATTIFTSLPVHTVLEATRQDTLHCIRLAHSEIVPIVIQGALGQLPLGGDHSWGSQIAATGALRVHYGLATCSRLGLDIHLDDGLFEKMLESTVAEGASPEFVVEMFKTLFSKYAHEREDPQPIVKNSLSYLQRHMRESHPAWNGKAHVLAESDAHSQGAVALFHLLLDRWMPLLETHASDGQLASLAALLLSTSSGSEPSSNTIDAHSIWVRTLHNAEFWEMHRFREVLMSRLQAATAPLQRTDLAVWFQQVAKDSDRIPLEDVRGVTAAFETLLYVPAEYLPRALRIEFLRRALVADVDVAGSTQEDVRQIVLVREFIRRTLAFVGSVEHPASKEYTIHLLKGPLSRETSKQDESLLSTTLDVLRLHFSTFVNDASKGDGDALASVFTLLSRPISPASLGSFGQILSHRCLLAVIDIVTGCEKSQFSAQLLKSLAKVHTRMRDVYCSTLQDMMADGDSAEIQWNIDILQSYSAMLKLTQWLGTAADDTLRVGPTLVGKLLRTACAIPATGRLCSSVSAILFTELASCPSHERGVHLDCVIVSYLAASRVCEATELLAMDGQLSASSKSLSVEDFGRLLDSILDTLHKPGKLSYEDLATLIRLSSILVHDAPQGSSRTTQNYITGALVLFADHAIFLTLPSVRHEVLELLNRHFNDHPAAIKPQDLSSIWSILGNLLSGSTQHDGITDATAYHAVVGILGALVRLRRDLLLRTLPHLGMVLAQLVMALRCVHPQLGGKQTRLVMNTLPGWIGSTQALGTDESKALARLLTTLLTKTLIRSHTLSIETQKPESLARPFSKHAAYVLTAYIQAVNDPLCTVSAQVRKELQPGLFALCEMMGEHSRDAMMVSALDGAGKVTMKTLWRDYEKQRYTGKG